METNSNFPLEITDSMVQLLMPSEKTCNFSGRCKLFSRILCIKLNNDESDESIFRDLKCLFSSDEKLRDCARTMVPENCSYPVQNFHMSLLLDLNRSLSMIINNIPLNS